MPIDMYLLYFSVVPTFILLLCNICWPELSLIERLRWCLSGCLYLSTSLSLSNSLNCVSAVLYCSGADWAVLCSLLVNCWIVCYEYYVVLRCVALRCIVLWCIMLFCVVLCYVALCCVVLCCFVLCVMVQRSTELCGVVIYWMEFKTEMKFVSSSRNYRDVQHSTHLKCHC